MTARRGKPSPSGIGGDGFTKKSPPDDLVEDDDPKSHQGEVERSYDPR